MIENTMTAILVILSGPVISGLVQAIKLWVKPTGIWVRMCALILGLIAGVIGAVTAGAKDWEGWLLWLVIGLLEGLVSTGLYEQLKGIKNQPPSPPAM